jgi:hypothetical protein
MKRVKFTKKAGNDFAAISLGKPRYFGESSTNISVNWGDGSVETITSLVSTGAQRITIKYTVKVEDRTGNKFVLYDSGGVEVSSLTFQEGNTYEFDQSDTSNASHTLAISLTEDGIAYTSNVTTSGTAGTDGTLKISILEGDSTISLSSGFYVKCTAHSSMGSVIGKILTDQQSLTLWHLYSNTAQRKIMVTGGFGSAVDAFDNSLKLCLAEESQRSPCSTHEDIIGIAGPLWVHGHGDFADMPLTTFNPAISILDSADPATTVLKTAGNDGAIRLINTFKGTQFRVTYNVKKFFINIKSSSVSLTSTSGLFQDSKFSMPGINFGSDITDMSFMFKNSSWNEGLYLKTSNVTTMESMFEGAVFNKAGANTWNTQNVISMKNMFKGNQKFNQLINGWFKISPGALENMSGMFESSVYSKQIIWKTNGVTDVSFLFKNNKAFNQSLPWKMGSVTNMESMFEGSVYNQRMNTWDVQAVTSMKNMFKNSSFDNIIAAWFKSSAGVLENMSGMFGEGAKFNQMLTWKTNGVTDMSFMFKNNKVFNQGSLFFKTGNVTTMEGMFEGSICNPNGLSDADTSKVESIKNIFKGSSFNKPLRWFKSAQSITDMSGAFSDSIFSHNTINQWNVSTVTDMSFVFSGNTKFNTSIDYWDVSSVTTMESMFEAATAFNKSIKRWKVHNVVSMKNMFKNSVFTGNHPIELGFWFAENKFGGGGQNPATYKIEDMSGMFEKSSYDRPLTSWVRHRPTIKRAIRMFANNTSTERGKMHKIFLQSPLLEDVSAIFEDSFSVHGNSAIGRWNIFADSDATRKAAQINVLKGNAFRGKIATYDYTAQEQSDAFAIPDFTTPDPVSPVAPGLDCVSFYQDKPPEDDSLNTIYFHVVDPN